MSADRLLVVGGDAAGMSAATAARRLRPAEDLAITVLEQGPDVSFSACGIPYWVGDPAIWAGLTAEEFAGSDLSYAPPSSPVYDPVVVAARVAGRVERG